MARKRKPRRRMVYSYTFGFQDGSVIACGPERKPFERRIKEEGIHIDEDGVFREALYSPTSWHSWNDEQRREAVTILANRLNMRRAIRDLVLPELKELKTVLLDIEKRLRQIEQAIAKADRRDATA
ncbi:MAG: hypothetical protein MUF25_16680 [Pirellulaceae bacterium]|nr:hypothetical protein [Pirellulaceae bacterium]